MDVMHHEVVLIDVSYVCTCSIPDAVVQHWHNPGKSFNTRNWWWRGGKKHWTFSL